MPVHLICAHFYSQSLQFVTLVSDYIDLVKSLASDVHHHQFETKQNILTATKEVL